MKDINPERAVRTALAMHCRRMTEISSIYASEYGDIAKELLDGKLVSKRLRDVEDACAFICQALYIFGDDYFNLRKKIFGTPTEDEVAPEVGL